MVSSGLEPLTIRFRGGGGRIIGEFANKGKEDEFVMRNRCAITRCICGCGQKFEFDASSK
jgi:hypothetical protein